MARFRTRASKKWLIKLMSEDAVGSYLGHLGYNALCKNRKEPRAWVIDIIRKLGCRQINPIHDLCCGQVRSKHDRPSVQKKIWIIPKVDRSVQIYVCMMHDALKP